MLEPPFFLQDAQKGLPARPQRVKDRDVLSGYIEGLNDARTLLEDVFSIRSKRQRPFDHHHHLPSHFDRLDRVVLRFHLDQDT